MAKNPVLAAFLSFLLPGMGEIFFKKKNGWVIGYYYTPDYSSL